MYTPFPVLSSVFTEALSYDSTGQILQQQWKHAGQGPQQQDYVYDAVQRLVGWKNGSGDSSFYQYDNIGNRNYSGSVGTVTASSNYSYDRASHGPDQMQSLLRNDLAGLVQSDYSYSADGAVTGRTQTNMTNGGQITRIEGYSQSYRGLLTGYTLNDVPNARTEAWGYHYNAMGEREQKRLYDMQGIVEGWDESKPWVYYLLGGNREQLAVYHGREQLAFSCGEPGPGVAFYPVEYNTYSGGTAPLTTRPDPVIANGTKEYRVLDHLGSVRVVLNALGVASATDYAPFGKAITANELRQGWIDKEKDRESGLGDFGVRKYEAEEGRFTSLDPLWEKYRAWTPYQYSRNSPLTLSDRLGLADWIDGDGNVVASDGNNDGAVWVMRDGVTIDQFRTDQGIDFAKLQDGSLPLPSEAARKAIIEEIYNRISPSLIGEFGGVVASAFVDGAIQETYLHGGYTEARTSHGSDGSASVERGYEKAAEQQMNVDYTVHSHPHPNAYRLNSGNLDVIPQYPSDTDLNTAKESGTRGIMVSVQHIVIYDGKGSSAVLSIPAFSGK